MTKVGRGTPALRKAANSPRNFGVRNQPKSFYIPSALRGNQYAGSRNIPSRRQISETFHSLPSREFDNLAPTIPPNRLEPISSISRTIPSRQIDQFALRSAKRGSIPWKPRILPEGYTSAPWETAVSSSVSSSGHLSDLSTLSRIGIGAGIGIAGGLIGSSLFGGNYGQGTLMGGAVGAGIMGLSGPRGAAMLASRGFQMGNKPIAAAIGGSTILGGGLMSGSRGQDKRRGFNSNRGNRI